MTTFEDREHAFEAKFAHDEEFRFLVAARRDKLFAHWAAAESRISGADKEALVKTVLAIPNGPGHHEALLRHVAGFLAAHGGETSHANLSNALDKCGRDAHQQLIEKPPEHSEVI